MRLSRFAPRLLLCVVVGLCAVMAGCKTAAEKPDANYAAYLQLIADQQKQQDDARTAFAQMAQKCTSDACVSQVAAIAALSGANSHLPPPQQYTPRESMAGKIGLALVSQLSPLASAAVAWHSADTSRDVSVAQFGFLGGTVHDLTGSVNALGQVAGTLPPTISVGRDYISGSVDNGTHVGGDQVGGDQTQVGGDQVGRDKIANSGLYNTGSIDRYQSPGPIDDHHASDDGCAGSTTCQVQNPPPTDPGTGTP